MQKRWTTACSLRITPSRQLIAGAVLVAATLACLPAAAQTQPPTKAAKAASNQSMPDIVGVRLGVPAREAFAVLQAANPKTKLFTDPLQLPIVDKPILNGFSVGYEPRNNYERVVVLVTPPPDKQVVWRVRRYVYFKEPVNRANVMASLREKYGKETVMFLGPSSQEKADEAHAAEMWWLFDEQGRPASLPNIDALHNTLLACAGKFDRGDDANNPYFAVENITPQSSRDQIAEGGWCNTSMIAVIAQITTEEILLSLQVDMVDIPAMTRAARAEVTALDAWAKAQQQQQVEASKQQKPKL